MVKGDPKETDSETEAEKEVEQGEAGLKISMS